jgi:large subunit ribosomal protein L10
MKHTKPWRESQTKEIGQLINSYKVVGIGDLNNYPANLLAKLKKNMVDAVFKVTSKSSLKRALEETNNKDLLENLPNQPILILTNNNAFELYGKIKKNKARSKAKIGMISPVEIVVPAGDTGLPPGPALSDLKKVGIKAQVKGATIFVPNDTTIAKVGDVITSDVVSTLSKLDIKPMELMLDVVAVKEDNLIYGKDVLDVDAETIVNNIILAVRSSMNLGIEVGYICEDTIEPMIIKAELEAKALDALANKN